MDGWNALIGCGFRMCGNVIGCQGDERLDCRHMFSETGTTGDINESLLGSWIVLRSPVVTVTLNLV